MRNVFFVTANAMVLLFSCSKDEPTVNNLAEKDVDIYTAGYEYNSNSNNAVATYWKNGIAVQLTDGSQSAIAYSISVSGGNVYVAGAISINVQTSPNSYYPVYWKNGERVDLTTNGSIQGIAVSISVSGETIYVAGIIASEVGGLSHGVYWRNSELVMLRDEESSRISSIAVSGNDVYVTGRQFKNFADGSLASWGAVWKNGSNVQLLSEDSEPSGLFVEGSDVYVSGWSPLVEAGYWKNGVATVLNLNGQLAGATGIAVSGNDVYVSGFRGVPYAEAVYWKNGVPVPMAGVPVAGVDIFSQLSSIAVSGSDVYTIGTVSYSGIRLASKVWRNATPLMTIDSLKQAYVNSIYVVKK